MSDIFITTTNIDLTEGRGTVKPVSVHRRVENAAANANRVGVMGTLSGVSVRRVQADTLVSDAAAKHGTLLGLDEAAGLYCDGIGQLRWGVIPERIEKLSAGEVRRLEQLHDLIGDAARSPEVEVPDESGSVLVVWSTFIGSVAGRPTPVGVPQILGVVTNTGCTAGAEEIAAQARSVNPGIARIYATQVSYGEKLALTPESAHWGETVRAEDVPEPDREALIEEYEELLRRAGIHPTPQDHTNGKKD